MNQNPQHPAMVVPLDWDFAKVVEPSLKGPEQDSTCYKIYDAAMVQWLKKLFVLDGGSIPVIPSAPSNVFANYRKLLEELGLKSKCPENIRDYAAYPLPMISVQRIAEDWREGGEGAYPIRSIAFIDSDKQGERPVVARRASVYTRYPKPMWFTYSVNLWALSKQHMSWMKQCLEMTFWNKLAYIRVKQPFSSLKGTPTQITAIHRKSGEDTTEATRDENSELIQRFTYKFNVEAWMWDSLMLAPTVLTHSQELIGKVDNESLGLVTIHLTPESPLSLEEKARLPHEGPRETLD